MNVCASQRQTGSVLPPTSVSYLYAAPQLRNEILLLQFENSDRVSEMIRGGISLLIIPDKTEE